VLRAAIFPRSFPRRAAEPLLRRLSLAMVAAAKRNQQRHGICDANDSANGVSGGSSAYQHGEESASEGGGQWKGGGIGGSEISGVATGKLSRKADAMEPCSANIKA